MSHSEGLAPAEEFAALVCAPDVQLDKAALCIAAHCRPRDVDIAATLAELDRLAAAVSEPTPDGVVDLLFVTEGFGGNRGRYSDPANSYLDLVVSRRLGIPISLAVVAIAVASRAGVKLHGAGMPGHFLVGTTDPDRFIDPFDGCFVDRQGAQAIFARFESRAPFEERFLAPTPSADILLRMLNNLRIHHMRHSDAVSLAAVLELLTRLRDCPAAEFMRLAHTLGALGRCDEGARALEQVAHRFDEREAESMTALARRLWAKLN